jgi:hypothetical protein
MIHSKPCFFALSMPLHAARNGKGKMLAEPLFMRLQLVFKHSGRTRPKTGPPPLVGVGFC